MKKNLLFILFLISIPLFGQSSTSEDLFQILPNWQLNDKLSVTTNSSNKIWANDTLISDINTVSTYNITVIDTTEFYRLRYTQKSTNLGMDFNSQLPAFSENAKVIIDFVKDIARKCEIIEFKVKVNKETGLAEAIENQADVIYKVKQITKNALLDLQKTLNLPKTESDSINLIMNEYLKKYENDIVQSSINGINYILQGYSYTFPINGTIKQPTTIYPINTIDFIGNKEMPATLVLSSKENTDNTIDVTIDTEYDKMLILFELKKDNNDAFKHLSLKDIEITEREKIKFNLDNSWIIKHESFVNFSIPKVRVEEYSTTTFNLLTNNTPVKKTTTTDFFQKGFDASNEGKYELAIKYYNFYLQQTNKDDLNALFNIAIAYYNLKKYDKALEYYKLVLEKDKNDGDIYNGIGNSYDELSQFDLAISNYKLAIKLNPKKSEYYYNIGNSYFDLKNFNEAIKYYLQAIAITPTYADAYSNLGNAYNAIGKNKEQIESYQKAAKLGQKSTQNWLSENGYSW